MRKPSEVHMIAMVLPPYRGERAIPISVVGHWPVVQPAATYFSATDCVLDSEIPISLAVGRISKRKPK